MSLQKLLQGPGPKEKVETLGVAGFKAAVITQQTIEQNAQAPTAWLEDGSYANDHIILDPVQFTVEGNVGDVYLQSSPTMERYREINSTIGRATTYLPERTQAQISRVEALAATARDALIKANTAVNVGQNVAELFGNQDQSKPLRERFVDTLTALRDNRQLVPIEFENRKYKNMAIVGLSITRDNERRAVEFEVTFKQLRFAETTFTDPANAFPNASQGTDGKTQGARDKGKQSGQEKPTSLLSSVLGWP
jgi:transcription-repair coupling factor (superfamily II helicase)